MCDSAFLRLRRTIFEASHEAELPLTEEDCNFGDENYAGENVDYFMDMLAVRIMRQVRTMHNLKNTLLTRPTASLHSP
jgi:hypothetical protein